MDSKSLGEEYLDSVISDAEKESVEVHYLDDSDKEKVEKLLGSNCGWYQDEETGAFVAGCDETTMAFPFNRVLFIRVKVAKKEKKTRRKRSSR